MEQARVNIASRLSGYTYHPWKRAPFKPPEYCLPSLGSFFSRYLIFRFPALFHPLFSTCSAPVINDERTFFTTALQLQVLVGKRGVC